MELAGQQAGMPLQWSRKKGTKWSTVLVSVFSDALRVKVKGDGIVIILKQCPALVVDTKSSVVLSLGEAQTKTILITETTGGEHITKLLNVLSGAPELWAGNEASFVIKASTSQ